VNRKIDNSKNFPAGKKPVPPRPHLLQAAAMVAFAPISLVLGSFARRIIGPASA
jgi:hypothetical protein